MSKLGTKGRRYFLLTTVLTVLLMGSLAVPAGAHPGHGGKHTDLPRVDDQFHTLNGVAPTPGQKLTCTWTHSVTAYVCKNNNGSYSQPLTIDKGANKGQGLLRAGGGAADYDVANPNHFSCNYNPDPAVVAPVNQPSSWACTYGNVKFRMHEMVMMEDPAATLPEPPPAQDQQFLYALPPEWPPHK